MTASQLAVGDPHKPCTLRSIADHGDLLQHGDVKSAFRWPQRGKNYGEQQKHYSEWWIPLAHHSVALCEEF